MSVATAVRGGVGHRRWLVALAGALIAAALTVPAGSAAAAPPATTAAAPAPVASYGPYDWFNIKTDENYGSCLEQLIVNRVGQPQMTAPVCTGSDGQWFWYDDMGGGIIQFRGWKTNSCIGQDYTGGTAHSGVVATACTGAAEQRWTQTQISRFSATYQFKNTRSQTCLDETFTSSGQPTGQLVMAACVPNSDLPSQGWNFTYDWDPPFA